MTKEDLEYIKRTLKFALDNGKFDYNDTEIIHSRANNSIDLIEEELDDLHSISKQDKCEHYWVLARHIRLEDSVLCVKCNEFKTMESGSL